MLLSCHMKTAVKRASLSTVAYTSVSTDAVQRVYVVDIVSVLLGLDRQIDGPVKAQVDVIVSASCRTRLIGLDV